MSGACWPCVRRRKRPRLQPGPTGRAAARDREELSSASLRLGYDEKLADVIKGDAGVSEGMRDMLASVRGIGSEMGGVVLPAFEALQQNVPNLSSAFYGIMSTAEQFGEGLARNLGQAIVYGQSLGDALVSSIKAAAAELITSGLLDLLLGGRSGGGRSGGLLGGLVGGLFGIPGFANGTDNAPGGLAMVGERGRELVRLPKGSQVLPNPDTERLMRGGGQERVVVDVQPSPLFVTTVRRTTQETAAATVNAAMRGNRRMKLAGAV